MEEEICELKAKHEELIAKENKIKSSKIEFDQEIEKFDSIIKDSKQKMNLWKKEVEIRESLLSCITDHINKNLLNP